MGIKPAAWQVALKNLVTDPAELLQLLALDPALLPAAMQASRLFPLRAPRAFIARMKKGDIDDPLLRQVLPLAEELEEAPGYSRDPLGEKAVNPVQGLLHKYHGRVLLTVAAGCAINCRYCFRRYFSYAENNPSQAGWQHALDYIAGDSSIAEVILSGSDPLIATDDYLARLAQKIAAIAHVKTLRIHTRLPIVLPERIVPEFSAWFTATRLRPVLAVHCNHPQEINDEVRVALQSLKNAGICLLNQTVLLKGVNDAAAVLVELSDRLFTAGVMPYYLHVLDRVQGAQHFDISEERAKQLAAEMARQLPGYLVPKLVREIPGATAKMPV
jgi:EF-P beta-lysylation protein EpmB